MAKTSKKRVSQAELDKLFNSEEFQTLLQSCNRVEYYNKPTPVEKGQTTGTSTVGHEYYSTENKRIALVFQYVKPDGNLGASGRPSPKEIVFNGVKYYV
jgi:hypothetical protein